VKFYWWDDAIVQARALAQWTNLRHKVRGVLEEGLWWWIIEPGQPLEVQAAARIMRRVEP
jgi:hypothetical protein